MAHKKSSTVHMVGIWLKERVRLCNRNVSAGRLFGRTSIIWENVNCKKCLQIKEKCKIENDDKGPFPVSTQVTEMMRRRMERRDRLFGERMG